MYSRDERESIPPKGVPKDLYDQADTLRWIRSMLGESKAWPDSQFRTSFLSAIQLLLDSQPIPSKTEIVELQNKLKASEKLVSELQLQLEKRLPNQMCAPQANVVPDLCHFWNHPKAILFAIAVGYIVCLIQKTNS